MTELFYSLLYAGLMACVTALAVFPLRWLFRRLRLPVLLCVSLWLVVLVRMLLPPGTAASPFSLMGWAAPAAERQAASIVQALEPEQPPLVQTQLQPAVSGPAAGESSPLSGAPYRPVPTPAVPAPPASSPADWGSLLPVIWLAGILALWGYTAASWFFLRLRLRAAVRRESSYGPYWESDRILSPFIFGLLRPRVYLPLGLDGETLDWVLRHERTHIRLGHHWLKLCFFLALGLHWYNPILWLAWVFFCRDLELHCDESVLRRAEPGAQRNYSAALLRLAAPQRGPMLPPGFAECAVKDRIKRALGYRKPGRVLLVLATALAALLAFCLGCDPVYRDLPKQPPALTAGLDGSYVQAAQLPAEDSSSLDLSLPEATAAVPFLQTGLATPILDLRLEGELPPSQVECTEYLLDRNLNWSAPLTRGAESFGGADGQYWALLDRRPDSSGEGMEHRLLVLRCVWDNGREQTQADYAVITLLPSAADGPMAQPIVSSDSRRIPLDDEMGCGVLFEERVTVNHPRGRDGSYTLSARVSNRSSQRSQFGSETYFISGGDLSAGGAGSTSFPVGPLGVKTGAYPLYPDVQFQWYTLTYTWAGGGEDIYEFTLRAHLNQPQLDLEHLRIRLPFEGWQDLGALLPAPASWSEEELAGRSEAESWQGLLSPEHTFVCFSGAKNGWAAVSISRGAGNADTYVYRTSNGGFNWREVQSPQGPGTNWFPCQFYARADGGAALLAFSRFEGAPIYRTADGGITWEKLELPLPEDAGECVNIVSDTELVFSGGPDGRTRYTLYSLDQGESWKLLSHTQAPEHIPLEQLPPVRWQTPYGGGKPYVDLLPYWYAPISNLGAVQGADIALYVLETYASEDGTRESRLLLRTGEHLEILPISYWKIPQMIGAQMFLEDYDADGVRELAILIYQGGGTGVSVWDLHILEPDGNGFRLADSLSGLGLSSGGHGLTVPAGMGPGQQVHYRVREGHIAVQIGLLNQNASHRAEYAGNLTGDVSYDGVRLDLSGLIYTENSWEE